MTLPEENVQLVHDVYNALRDKLNRSLNVLDLGCAQGFMSFNIASCQMIKETEWGGRIVGIDPLDQNINVCNLIKSEHSNYEIDFVCFRVEDAIEIAKKNYFDMVLWLNSFSDLCKYYNFESVKYLIKTLAEKVDVAIFELPFKQDYRNLFIDFNCVKLLSYDGIKQLIFASNKYVYFQSLGMLEINQVLKTPGDYAVDKNQSRYYFCGDKFVKYFDRHVKNFELFMRNAAKFLKEIDGKYGFPKLYEFEVNQDECWLVRQNIEGETLASKIKNNESYDAWDVIKQILNWLIILEENNYYHFDINVNNTVLNSEGKAYLIDYCSISDNLLEFNEEMFSLSNLMLKFFSFVYCIFERKPEEPFSVTMPFLLKYISPKKYLKMLKITRQEKIFRQIYNILFNEINDGEKDEYSIADVEKEWIVKRVNETHRILVNNLDYANYVVTVLENQINDLNAILSEQNKRIEDLENKLKQS